MKKIDQINKARSLLASALSAAHQSLSGSQTVQDARTHMKIALRKLGEAGESQADKSAKTSTEHQKWWGSIVAGTATQSHSKTAIQPVSKIAQQAVSQQKTLAQLNSLISQEEKAIEELDKKQTEQKPELFEE